MVAVRATAGDQVWRAPSYVDRILKGAKPAYFPLQNPIKFELVINLKTAQAAPSLVDTADELME
jgi:ABC-type uncharacterized transport system substrate-binding protein